MNSIVRVYYLSQNIDNCDKFFIYEYSCDVVHKFVDTIHCKFTIFDFTES